MQEAQHQPRRINLGLQGGGTHGAFTWGVLDRLLEDERILIDGISGTSAGAMNGTILVQGFHKGGAQGARAELDRFWLRMSELGWLNPFRRSLVERLQGSWNLDENPAALWLEQMNVFLSPYQTNPLNRSRLRTLLEETIDFKAICEVQTIKLFVAATNVRTGRARIFRCSDLSLDALLASACMPQIYQAVMIDGEAYWDGGFVGNPALWPLIYESPSPDIIIVQVIPLRREEVPQTAAEIMNRLNEITFNLSLMAQLRTIAVITELVTEPGATGPQIDRLKKKNLFIHHIAAEEAMKSLGVASQLNTELDFLLYLKELGRQSADRWLQANFAALNHRSTFDTSTLFE